MSSVVERSGVMRQLDRRAEPDEQVTEDQVSDPGRLSRLLMRLLREVVALRLRWAPRFVDHQDVTVDDTGTTLYRFPHGFGRRVNWWPIDWVAAAAGPQLVRHEDSDNDTLVLVSYEVGTVTLRLEEAG